MATTAFPRMSAYLDSLPRGLDSYPAHVQKAGVFRQLLGAQLKAHAAGLPDVLRVLVETPPPVGSWVPEVHTAAIFVAMRDVMPDDHAFQDHMYRMNRALLDGVLYGFLFRLISPRRILDGARSRWTQLHRGITFEVLPHPEENQSGVCMRFPTGLVPVILLESYCGAFRAALEVAGGKNVKVHLVESAPVMARYAATWE